MPSNVYRMNNELEKIRYNKIKCWGGGGIEARIPPPTLIVRLWICALKTFCPGIPHWTQWSPKCTQCACRCETGLASAGFPWRWKSLAVSWSRPVAPLVAASHILPERKAWALARPLREKPLCGSSPQKHYMQDGQNAVHSDSCQLLAAVSLCYTQSFDFSSFFFLNKHI
jgi:hypothetical protein